MAKFEKILEWTKKVCNLIKERTNLGWQWMGKEGLICMETSALLTIFFMIFFPSLWSMIFALIVVSGKCAFDKSQGSTTEVRDLICSCLGVLFGVILGAVHAATIIHFFK